MNVYDRQNMLAAAIEDAERRLGSYIASEGTSREDAYAQQQIKHINNYTKQLNELYTGKENN